MRTTITPGKVWLDTNGNRIQAHGGSIITVKDTFYWYGENKEKTTGEDEIWHWGVRCYSSNDLYNWKDEGIIIPPDTENPSSPLHPTSYMDRPHIIYNKKNQKFVCWLKIMGEPPYFTILEADDILGPYKMVSDNVNPFNLGIGDFDLSVDELSGKAYLFSQKPHTSIYVVGLNDNYTDVEGSYREYFPKIAPPDAREAPAHFFRKGKHYLITSGTTGYYPNPSEYAISSDWLGDYVVMGDPHEKDPSKTSFNSQISSVFKNPKKKDLYIALADRWKPAISKDEENYSSGQLSNEIQEKFRAIFDPETEFVFTEEDAKEMQINSSLSDYVWLPILFKDDQIKIEWKEEWRIEDFN
jgi:hypothetical protein